LLQIRKTEKTGTPGKTGKTVTSGKAVKFGILV
jgi:hypothetical protein